MAPPIRNSFPFISFMVIKKWLNEKPSAIKNPVQINPPKKFRRQYFLKGIFTRPAVKRTTGANPNPVVNFEMNKIEV